MRTPKIICLSSLLAICLGQTPGYASFVSLSMSFSVSGTSNFASGGGGASFSTSNAGDLGSGYLLAEDAFILGGNPDGRVSPYAEGLSTWTADGNSGHVYIGWGWAADGANSVNTNLGGPNWAYSFVADFDGRFVMDFGVVGSGFGVNGVALTHDFDTGSGAPVLNAFNPSSSGTFIGDVTAGQTYIVSLMNNGNVYGDNISAYGYGISNFDWYIERTARVPDAGSTGFLIAMAGLSLAWFRGRHGSRTSAISSL